MCSSGGEHQIDSHTETLLDGSVRPVTYCVKCGMEWH